MSADSFCLRHLLSPHWTHSSQMLQTNLIFFSPGFWSRGSLVLLQSAVLGQLREKMWILERSLLSFPTVRRELGKKCGCLHPAGSPLVCFLLLVNVCPLVEAHEVIVMSREISRGLNVLMGPGRFQTPLLLTSSSHPPSPLRLCSGEEPQAHLRLHLRY